MRPDAGKGNGVLVRQVRPEDLDQAAAIEAACFPPAEAATREAFAGRIAVYPASFLVAERDGLLVGLINGCCTHSPVIRDALFHDPALHEPAGANQTILGLDVLPAHRKHGIAALLMRSLIQSARDVGRKALILTCKEPLIPYYETFGYRNDGPSQSTHGDAQWYDMTLTL